jgi:hypothetical protein
MSLVRLSSTGHDLLLLFAGPIVWGLHFLAIYGFTGVACARPAGGPQGPGLSWQGWMVIVAGLVAAAVLLACVRARPRSNLVHNREFLRVTGLALIALALLAIAWETLAVVMLPGCWG